MGDQIVLGLRASNLQERLVHELAEVSGAYFAAGLNVDTLVGSTPHGLSAGVASALFDTADGTAPWDVLLVSCTEPLFWVTAGPRLSPADMPANRTLSCLLALAGSAPPDATARGGLTRVLGPAAVVDIATHRIAPMLDVGKRAGFPAIGLAGRREGYEADVATRLARTHIVALQHLQSDPGLVREVLHRRFGIASAELPPVASFVRRRFRLVPRCEARSRAVRGISRLGLDVAAAERAFANHAPDCSEPVWN